MLRIINHSETEIMEAKIYQKPWFWYLVALVIVALDQASKHAIEAAFEYGETLVFTSFFNFTLAYNTGAAFSFLADAGGWQRWFFIGLAGAVSVMLLVWIWRTPRGEKLLPLALATAARRFPDPAGKVCATTLPLRPQTSCYGMSRHLREHVCECLRLSALPAPSLLR